MTEKNVILNIYEFNDNKEIVEDEVKNVIVEQEQKITKYAKALERNEERRKIYSKKMEEETKRKKTHIPSIAYPKNFVRALSPPRQLFARSNLPLTPTYCRCGYLDRNDNMKAHLKTQEHVDKMNEKKRGPKPKTKIPYVPPLVRLIKNIQCGTCKKMFSENKIRQHFKEEHGDHSANDEKDITNYKCGCGSLIKKTSMNSHFNTEAHKTFMIKYNNLQQQLKRENKI